MPAIFVFPLLSGFGQRICRSWFHICKLAESLSRLLSIPQKHALLGALCLTANEMLSLSISMYHRTKHEVKKCTQKNRSSFCQLWRIIFKGGTLSNLVLGSETKFSFAKSLALPNACIIEIASEKTNSSSNLQRYIFHGMGKKQETSKRSMLVFAKYSFLCSPDHSWWVHPTVPWQQAFLLPHPTYWDGNLNLQTRTPDCLQNNPNGSIFDRHDLNSLTKARTDTVLQFYWGNRQAFSTQVS